MKNGKYLISTNLDDEDNMLVESGKIFNYKDLSFGMVKVNGYAIVTELSTGLKVNNVYYEPKTYKQAVELMNDYFYNAIVKTMETEYIKQAKEKITAYKLKHPDWEKENDNDN